MSRLHGAGKASAPRCCALLGVSKQAYYKQTKRQEKESLKESLLPGEVLKIRKELPVPGGRKLFHLVSERLPALCPGRDAFFKLLGAHGLLIRRQRLRRPTTTVSWHHFHKFGNLWKGRIPEAPNQVWVADITYIRLEGDRFIYLSLLTDVYSHKIVGWHLSHSLSMEGPLAALQMALVDLPKDHKLMHHSDRGVQYCCNAYVELLQSRGILISMTEKGDPRENAVAERVNGILKQEWINRENIQSLKQGREVTGRIIEIYNKKRPHLSNDYLTPQQAHGQTGTLKRRWHTYYKNREDVYNVQNDGVSL